MRIISGKYKGRVIQGFDLIGTRPTMDRVKESLFGSIQMKIPGSVCLDLFAGSGNLGIEAFSQGAKEVVFVDNNKNAIKVIQQNLKNLGVEESFVVKKADFKMALEEMKGKQFDLIFIDPPYQSDAINDAMKLILQYHLIKDGGLIVLESDKYEKLSYDKTYYVEKKVKRYGDKYIMILEKKRA